MEKKTYEDCLQFVKEHQIEFGAEYNAPEDVIQTIIENLPSDLNITWNDVYDQLDIAASYYWSPII